MQLNPADTIMAQTSHHVLASHIMQLETDTMLSLKELHHAAVGQLGLQLLSGWLSVSANRLSGHSPMGSLCACITNSADNSVKRPLRLSRLLAKLALLLLLLLSHHTRASYIMRQLGSFDLSFFLGGCLSAPIA